MNQNVKLLLQLLLELRVKHIFIGKIILIRIHLRFRIYADFQADNEIDKSNISKKKTTNIYKQNQVLNGYHLVSELSDVLKSGYYESPSGYKNVDWFVDEVMKNT